MRFILLYKNDFIGKLSGAIEDKSQINFTDYSIIFKYTLTCPSWHFWAYELLESILGPIFESLEYKLASKPLILEPNLESSLQVLESNLGSGFSHLESN